MMDKEKVISTTKANSSIFRRYSNPCTEKSLKPNNGEGAGEIFPQKITPEGESALLVPFFNFFYYLALVPFKTELVRKTNSYCLRTNIIQQITCGILHVFIILYAIYLLVASCLEFKQDTQTSIIAMLESACNFSSLISLILILLIVWRKRERDLYLRMIELTRCNLKHPKVVAFMVHITVVVLCLITSILSWFLIHESVHYSSVQNLKIYEVLNPKNSTESGATEDPSFHKNFTDFKFQKGIALVYNALILHSNNFYIFAQGVFFILALALRQVGKKFRTKLNDLNEVADIPKGILLYRELKGIANLIRKLYGNSMLAFYISSVSYYAETPYILLGNRGDSERVILIYFIINGFNWVVAAEFHYNTFNSVLDWISTHTDGGNLSCDLRFRLLSISSEMSADPIALSCRCFSVTYQHLGSMLSLIVTYGIIVFQLNRS